MDTLNRLATLIAQRNQTETEVSDLVGHPLKPESLGAYVASQVFVIDPLEGAEHLPWTGRFREGSLAGKTVAVQWRLRWDGLLSLSEGTPAEYLLVLAGPEALLPPEKGDASAPWAIESVFLFHLPSLLASLRDLRRRIGPSAHIPRELWESARLLPEGEGAGRLTEEQKQALALFSREETLLAC